MRKLTAKMAILIALSVFFQNICCAGLFKGIYLTQSTAENTKYLTYLIEQAKAVGITTFVVDLEIPSKKYAKNMQLLKENNISYVARIVMFPNGGTRDQVENPAVWQKRYKLVQDAISYGANEIQLDYIRYAASNKPSPENAKNILRIIQWYKDRLAEQKIPLQIDVFGVSSFGEARYIGQSIPLFSKSVDVVCPMVYPSHYEPFREHAVRPYETVYDSLKAIQAQFTSTPLPFKLMPYIELSNYRYPLSHQKKLEYIYAQIRAVQASGADGWYAWSAHNRYENLFNVLKSYPVK